MALEFYIQVCVLGEGQLQHGRVWSIIQDMLWDMSSIQSLPDLIRCLRVAILHQGLEPSRLLEGCQLVNKPKSAEDQM